MLVSGYADLDSAISAINRVGVDRLLTKPWNSNELVGAVRAAAEHARLVRENAEMTEALRRKNQELAGDQPAAGPAGAGADRQPAERAGLGAGPAGLGDPVAFAAGGPVCPAAGAGAGRDAATSWTTSSAGATLHDIGKIGVRDAVLLKPGPLDAEEWREMKRHPALGYEILKSIKFLEGARLIPLHHQERWDGTGYPVGPGGRADLPGRPHLRGGRHLRRHHQRPALPRGAHLRRRPRRRSSKLRRARSSIPGWSRPG